MTWSVSDRCVGDFEPTPESQNSALGRVISALAEFWPEHRKFLSVSLGARSSQDLERSEQIAAMIERLADGRVDVLCSGYRWMCNMMRTEALEFARVGNYRLSAFEDAFKAIYSNRDVMEKYMNGLLLSQVVWCNHATMLNFYTDEFLGRNKAGGKLLEIGPGHGLLLALAAREGSCSELSGWDVSEISLQRTAKCLTRLGVAKPTNLKLQSVFAAADMPARFESVVISEVCEHLEQPLEALRALKQVMVAGGRIFVNIPINAPAIDHIYLLRTPEEVLDLVDQAGFGIEGSCFAPAAGYSEALARKRKTAISVGIIGTVA